MKNLIRRIAVFTALALILCNVPCFAGSDAVVTGETVTATPGKEIEYRVSISGNPGLTGFKLKVKYDAGVLEYLSCEQGGFSSFGSMTCGASDGVCSVLWYHTANVAADGTLFTLRFAISGAAALGTYPVTITSEPGFAVNKAEEPITLNCSGGAVIVREFIPKFYAEQKTVAQGEEFLYAVSVEDNPGIAAYHIQVLFDTEVLEFADSEQPYQLPDGVFGQNFVGKHYPNAFEAIWYSQQNISTDGTLFYLRFKVKRDVPTGISPITVQYISSDTVGEDEQPVQFTCIAGELEIGRSAEIRISFPNARGADVSIDNAQGQIIIAALYDENHRLLSSTVKDADEENAVLHLTGAYADCAYCNVFTVNSQLSPICDAIRQERS